jgi:hypothetical protein
MLLEIPRIIPRKPGFSLPDCYYFLQAIIFDSSARAKGQSKPFGSLRLIIAHG